MSEALITTMITYGPLGIAVVGLAYALALVYRNAGSAATAHAQQIEALHTSHASAVADLHKRHSETVADLHKQHRETLSALHTQHTSALREVIDNATRVAEGNTEYIEKLSNLIDRLVPEPAMQATPAAGTRRSGGNK